MAPSSQFESHLVEGSKFRILVKLKSYKARLIDAKSKAVDYLKVIRTDNCVTLEQLKEASSRRKAVAEISGSTSLVTKANAREIYGGLTSLCEQDVHKLENYLTLLENLVDHITKQNNMQMHKWIIDLNIRWSSGLISSSLFSRSPKFYQVNDIYFELAMTLFFYGTVLRERTLEILSSDMVQSAMLFRKAAGVYKYSAEEIVSHINYWKERPPEATFHVCSVMSLVCLAEAQAVTARKAEENGKSNGLLAKLHYGVTDFLVEAIDIMQGNIKECKDISFCLMDFLVSCKALHELQSYKNQAVSLKEDGKIGTSIGVLQKALTNAKKSVPKEELWRSVYKHVMDDLCELLRKYDHENDFVHHEKVPGIYELPWPQVLKIVSHITYQPQKAATTLVFKFL